MCLHEPKLSEPLDVCICPVYCVLSLWGNLLSLAKGLGKRQGGRKQFNKESSVLQLILQEKQAENNCILIPQLPQQRAGSKDFFHSQALEPKKSNKDCRSLF